MGVFLPWYTFTALILLAIHGFNTFGGLCVDIIGGNEVAPHSRPFMAQIKGKRGIICGGALIKENWVLTAAHCKVKKSKIILGAHSLNKREKEQQAFQIAKDIPHPCYDPSTKENDIMLLQGDEPREFLGPFFLGDIVWSANPAAWGIGDALVTKLQGRAKLNKVVQTIPLPSSDADPKPGTVCTVAGWGMTRNRPVKFPTALMEVNITVIGREICNDKKHYNGKPIITENMICAGAKNKDSCRGDSGGPLRCNNIMRGITSFGTKECGNARGPGVYTRLTKRQLEWIRKTIGGA